MKIRFGKFLELTKLDICRISKSKINKFPEFHNLKNERISRIFSVWKTKAPKISKFFNCSSIRYLERQNVERPIFRNYKISYIKIPKDYFILNLKIFSCFL